MGDLFDNIANVCSNHVPLKRPKKSTINKFHKERKILTRRRTKLNKKTIPCPKVTQEIIVIEAAICSCHRDEKYLMNHGLWPKLKKIQNTLLDLKKKLAFVRLTLVL